MSNYICTFRDLFKDYLEMSIKQGGDVETIVDLVNAYQNQDPEARQAAFCEWLANEIFLCERCDHEFKADTRTTEEEHLVLCFGCADEQRGHEAGFGRKR